MRTLTLRSSKLPAKTENNLTKVNGLNYGKTFTSGIAISDLFRDAVADF